jgi:phosphatidylglycerol:prolipoprotein diacylglycerol transferase
LIGLVNRAKDIEERKRERMVLNKLQQKIAAAIESNPTLKQFKNQLLLDITSEGLRIQIVDEQNRPMFDLAGMGFLIGQGCGRWGNFFNQEAFGCNTTLPWGMFSEATEEYLMGSTVTVPKGVTIDPAMPVHPTFLYESIWCFVGLALLAAYIKKRKFNGDIALRYLVWYGAGRFWIESLRTDSLLLVPSLGLRASQLVAAAAVVGGVALEIFLTRKYKSKPLMVTLALTAENRSLLAKVRKAEPEFTVEREELVASSPRKLFLERTNAYNERVKQQLKEKLAEKN